MLGSSASPHDGEEFPDSFEPRLESGSTIRHPHQPFGPYTGIGRNAPGIQHRPIADRIPDTQTFRNELNALLVDIDDAIYEIETLLTRVLDALDALDSEETQR